MKTFRVLMIPLFLFVGLGLDHLQSENSSSDVSETRIILCEVLCGDEVAFRASTSDDGTPNADEVWGYISKLKFESVPEFSGGPGDTDGYLMTHFEEPSSLELRISYGGRLKVKSLYFEHRDGGWWISAEKVKQTESHRWIRRNSVEGICDDQHVKKEN